MEKLLGKITSGRNEAKRLQYIEPVLLHVCDLLPGVQIVAEEVMRGLQVHAHGRFEYVLKYNRRKVCIVEAKMDNFQQGKVQYLLECEVVADTEKCEVVYGIVINYLQWNFFENDSDVVRYEEIDYLLKSRKNQSPDLKALTAVIYARMKITNME